MRDSDLADSPFARDDSFTEELYSEEQANFHREAAMKLLPILMGTIDFIRSAKPEEMPFRADLAAYVFNHPSVAGISMEALGTKHGKTRAAVSAQVIRFQRENHLPEIMGQKSKESRQKYHTIRKSQLCKTN